MKKVYCAGLLFCDIPLRPVPPSIFQEDHCLIDAPVWSLGGDAANVAAALSKLGGKAIFSGLAGRDMYGDFLAARLRDAGVDTRGLVRHPFLPSDVCHILIEPGGERHFLVRKKLNDVLDYSFLREELIAESDIVYLGSCMALEGMDRGGTEELFRKAKSMGKITAADCAGNSGREGGWLVYLAPVLENCDIFMPSYGEAAALTGKRELPDIREALSGFGIKTLVVKLGSRGSYLTDFSGELTIPAFTEFAAVDTTGAGDSFVAGFLRGILEGWDNERAAVFASCVAGHNVTKVGATGGVPDFETARRYMKEHPR